MDKFSTILIGAIAAGVPSPNETEWFYLEITTAYFGVPFNVLTAAAFGSLVGVLKDKKDNNGDVIINFLGSVILSVFVSVFFPLISGYRWDSTGVQAIVTMMLGYTSQSWGSILIEEVGPGLKGFLNRFVPYRKDGEQ